MTGFSLSPSASRRTELNTEWKGASKILGPQWAHLPVITICCLGTQILWSVETSNASPYLLSLGLTKSGMAMVFLAGPLSGLIMQPAVGVLSDASKSRFGRRRPYMVGGTLLSTGALLLLGSTRPFASIFTRLGTSSNDVLTVWLAVASIYCIDFAVNAVQAMNRALLVDSLSVSQQSSGNAWAACMSNVGGMVGFFVANIDLPRIFPFFGKSQLEVLSVVAAMILVSTQMLTAFCVREKKMITSKASSSGFGHGLVEIISDALTLPRVIRQIFIIQFFTSLAWFPVLFYTSLYIGELHKRSHPLPPFPSNSDILALDAEATRLGSRALFCSAVLSLGSNIVLPLFVVEAKEVESGKERGRTTSSQAQKKVGLLERVGMQIHLATLWAFSLAIFALCMAGTLFTSSVFGATVLITVTGFSWAIVIWAPSSLLGEAILTDASNGNVRSIRLAHTRTSHPDEYMNEEQQFLVDNDYNPDGFDGRQDEEQIELDDDATGMVDSGSGKAGIILGIQNVFVVVPQFLVTGLSSIIFAIFDPRKSLIRGDVPARADISTNGTMGILRREEERYGPNAITIIFQVGGVSAAIASVMCWRLAKGLKHNRL